MTENITENELFTAKPILLVEANQNGKLSVNSEAIQCIKNINGPVAVIIIAGMFRTGKSYIMNRLINQQNGFKVGNTIKACTRGIWMWNNTNERNQDGVTYLFMDTEGFAAPGSSKKWDAKIFTLSFLLASLLIYNTKNAIDSEAIEKLSCVRSISETINCGFGKITSVEGVDFLWIVRDFFLKCDKSPDQYLEDELKSHIVTYNCRSDPDSIKNENEIKISIRKAFRRRYCRLIPVPIAEEKNTLSVEEQIRNLENVEWTNLRSEFKTAIEEFFSFVRLIAEPKKIQQKVIDGRLFAKYIEEVVPLIDCNKKVDISSCFDAAILKANDESITLAQEHYSKSMDNFILTNKLPQTWVELQNMHIRFLKKSCDTFTNKNVGTPDKILNLRNKLTNTIEEKWKYYRLQNSEEILNFNKTLMQKLYEKYVSSELKNFQSTEEAAEAIQKFEDEFEKSGFRGKEMINLKNDFKETLNKHKESVKARLRETSKRFDELKEREVKSLEELERIVAETNENLKRNKDFTLYIHARSVLENNKKIEKEARKNMEINYLNTINELEESKKRFETNKKCLQNLYEKHFLSRIDSFMTIEEADDAWLTVVSSFKQNGLKGSEMNDLQEEYKKKSDILIDNLKEKLFASKNPIFDFENDDIIKNPYDSEFESLISFDTNSELSEFDKVINELDKEIDDIVPFVIEDEINSS